MYLLAKYNTATTITFPMIKAGVRDFAVSADWTPATGDTKVMKDGGAIANTTNNPVIIASSANWSLALTAAELSAAVTDIQIVDSATKAVEDQFLKVYTFGNASAKIAADLSDNIRLGLSALPADSKLSTLTSRMTTGTVSNASFTTTATQFECADITEATASHYVGCAVYATSGNLVGQCLGVCTAYTLTSGKGHFTVSPGSPSAEILANANTVLIV